MLLGDVGHVVCGPPLTGRNRFRRRPMRLSSGRCCCPGRSYSTLVALPGGWFVGVSWRQGLTGSFRGETWRHSTYCGASPALARCNGALSPRVRDPGSWAQGPGIDKGFAKLPTPDSRRRLAWPGIDRTTYAPCTWGHSVKRTVMLS